MSRKCVVCNEYDNKDELNGLNVMYVCPNCLMLSLKELTRYSCVVIIKIDEKKDGVCA